MVKVWNMAIASKELASRQAILVGLLTYKLSQQGFSLQYLRREVLWK